MNKRVYLDNNATTEIDSRVVEAMTQELSSPPSNPSSAHSFGQEARSRLVKARETIAKVFQVKPTEVIFTSGGTESMNLLLRGLIPPTNSWHIITSDVEHSCVYQTLKEITKEERISHLPAGLWGAIRPEAVMAAIRPDTKLIVLSAVNSETGVKTDIEAIAEIALNAKIPFIVDGVALMGKELFQIPKGVAGIGFSAHKFHGPKGVGFAIIRSSLALHPQCTGGGQEMGRRSGTENLPGIMGLAKAVELLHLELPKGTELMKALKERLEVELIDRISPVIINGQGPRVVNTSNISFPRVSGEDLLISLDLAGIAVSHGSACSSGALEPSRILNQMGVDAKVSKSSIRISLSRYTTLEEIEHCVDVIVQIVNKFRTI